MIAIYRANPSAFQTDLNVLHTGEVLRLPSAEELAAISPADAEREYQAQLAALLDRPCAGSDRPSREQPWCCPNPSRTLHLSRPTAQPSAHRVESLEQSLQEVRRELQAAHATDGAAATAGTRGPPAAPNRQPGRD